MRSSGAAFTFGLILFATTSVQAAPLPVADPVPASPIKDATVGIFEFFDAPNTADGLNWTGIQNIQPLGFSGNRLAINDTRGVIWATDRKGSPAVKYLDLRPNVLGFDYSFHVAEAGLHGVAFHPNFNGDPGRPGYGKFYTGFSTFPGGTADFHDQPVSYVTGAPLPRIADSVIIEWSTDPNTSAYSETTAPREVLRIGDPGENHNVGSLVFNTAARPGDADYGKLYVGYGDGASGFDPYGYASDLRTPWGKVIRIDPLDPDGDGPAKYGIPSDNPFVGQEGLDEIYASGFRHPQHLSFDSQTGDLYIADFGEARLEEVNIGIAGGNYGWPYREGTFRTFLDVNGFRSNSDVFPLDGIDATDGLVYPVVQYDHDEGNGVTGAMVYRGTAVPELQGKLVFSEIVRGRLFYADLADLQSGTPAAVHEYALRFPGSDSEVFLQDLVGNGPLRRVDMRLGFDQEGEIYILNKSQGKIWKLIDLETNSGAVETGGIELASGARTSSNPAAEKTNFADSGCGLPSAFSIVGLSGNVSIASGSVPGTRLAPTGVNGCYLSVGHGSITIDLGGSVNYLGMYVGSLDEYNSLQFFADSGTFGVLGEAIGFAPFGTLLDGAALADRLSFDLYGNPYLDFTFSSDRLPRYLRISSLTNSAFEVGEIAWTTAGDSLLRLAVAQVPSPGALSLFGLGVLGLAARRRIR